MVEERYIIEGDNGYELVLKYSDGDRKVDFTGSLSEILAYIELQEKGYQIL